MTPDLRHRTKTLRPRWSNQIKRVNAEIARMRAEREEAAEVARDYMRAQARRAVGA